MMKSTLTIALCLVVTASMSQHLRLGFQELHSDSVFFEKYDPGKSKLFTSSYDGKTKVWDVKSRKVLLSTSGYISVPTGESWLSGNRMLVIEGSEKHVKMVDMITNRPLHVFSVDSFEKLVSNGQPSEKRMNKFPRIVCKAYFRAVGNQEYVVILRDLGNYRQLSEIDYEIWRVTDFKLMAMATSLGAEGDLQLLARLREHPDNKVSPDQGRSHNLALYTPGNRNNNLADFTHTTLTRNDTVLVVYSSNQIWKIDLVRGSLKKAFPVPQDTSLAFTWEPLITKDSIRFQSLPVYFKKIDPLYFQEDRFVFTMSHLLYQDSAVFNLEKDQYYEYRTYGFDSLSAFKISTDGQWRAEIQYRRLNGEERLITSVYFQDKRIFAMGKATQVDFSSDGQYIRVIEPATKRTYFFVMRNGKAEKLFPLPPRYISAKKNVLKEVKYDTTLVPMEDLKFYYDVDYHTALLKDPVSSSFWNFASWQYSFREDVYEGIVSKSLPAWESFVRDSTGLFVPGDWISFPMPFALNHPHRFSIFTNQMDSIISHSAYGIRMGKDGNKYLTLLPASPNDVVHDVIPWEWNNVKTEDQPVSLKLCTVSSGQCITLPKTRNEFNFDHASFSRDGKRLFSFSGHEVLIFDPDQPAYEIKLSVDEEVRDVKLTRGNTQAIITCPSKIVFWDLGKNEELFYFKLTPSRDLVVVHPSGLFDGNQQTLANLHFVQDGKEVIELNQLKERYYEPGLWKKIIAKEKLRSVTGMKAIELPPDVQVGQVSADGYLPIELINKGGGIGQVGIFINGKEAIKDARPQGSDPRAPKLSLKIFVANHKALAKGVDNFIGVKAWNEEHWVVGRSTLVTYPLSGAESANTPAIHIIACGVSDYTGTELDLKYAAKDAEDVSRALQLGAEKLFGTTRSYTYTLTTQRTSEYFPTKTNILNVFEKVLTTAGPQDVIVVYLSGHGINIGGQDGDWHYLTQEAYTASSTAYNDPGIREKTTLSSTELVELFKSIPALKQVLLIDACASGRVVENLMTQRDIPSSTLRALDRMRDRAGLHIITGCTADAVSYEASKYGQGVLTYSLLEGIRGAALRDNQFVDINKLFQYAHDRVPDLASGIGGIQSPQVFSPQGGQSFDIGQLDDQGKLAIPIAAIKPVYMRSTFIDDDQLDDVLELGKAIDEALNEAAAKGAEAKVIFIDIANYPQGCKLSGRYTQRKGVIKLQLRRKCEGRDETINIQGKSRDEIKTKILAIL